MKLCTPFGGKQFDPPANHDVELSNFEEMKKMTAKEFIASYLAKEGYPSDENWVEEAELILQQYAEHLEETAWVSVGDELPPEIQKKQVSEMVHVFVDGRGSEDRFDFEHNQWLNHKQENVTHWRHRINPPKQ